MKIIPKGYVRDLNNHPISFDTEGNLVDLISGEKGTMMLPEITVTKINPKNPLYNHSKYITLYTYYPIVSRYPYTGHSRLLMTAIDKDRYRSYNISKTPRHKDYNLITNNCSDATREALEKTFNKKSNTLLFTTPGDVQDFALKQLNGIPEIKGDSIYDRTSHKYILNKLNNKRLYDRRKVVYIPINDNLKNFLKLYIEQGHKNHLFKKGGNIILKGQLGLITLPDNTKVLKPLIVLPFKLSKELLAKLLSEKNQSRIYDKDKADYYRNLLRAYNSNFFGYGVFGNQTNYDPTTAEGLQAISSTFNYARGNALDFLANLSGVVVSSGISKVGSKAAQVYSKLTKGVFKPPSSNGALGTLKQYAKNPIGGGAEAVVIKNTPTTVGKITSIPVEEMAARNTIPNTIKSKYIGYVKDRKIKLPTYILKKVKVLTEETFPKYVDKLDKAMERGGFTRVNDPNVLYRAYTNGQVVVDDVSPGNVGLTFLRQPKMIDFNLLPVSEWVALGFKLYKGGKLKPNEFYFIDNRTII